ncbi:MAG: DUF2752 domain-containing protein [Lachnospiraceae bacterium]|nr:DUF2752 domain-containing protein [Lachnospiraceae bacterium]
MTGVRTESLPDAREPGSAAERLRKELKKLALLLALGLSYALWVHFTHLGIPCPFYTFLHVKCPGCGMTHAALAALKLDFTGAVESNLLALTVVPLLLVILAVYELRYIRTGERRFNLAEKILLGISAYGALAYAILRNLGVVL